MKSICNRTRVTDPAGIWDYRNLIGAQVMIASKSVANLYNVFSFDSSFIHTIEDIYFRVTTDGKTITIIRLQGMPDSIFTWKDLEVLNLSMPSESICGLACCGTAICNEL